MANFTKGPWKSTRLAPFSYEITTDHPRDHRNYGVIVHEIRCEENARLIAAAPELFEALQALLDVTPFATDSKQREIHLRAEAAIAKAVSRG